MEFKVKKFSSLEKIRNFEDLDKKEVHQRTVLQGERLSYQICIKANNETGHRMFAKISVQSELADYVRLYFVKDVYMDRPTTAQEMPMEDYITQEPGFMPDVLIPLEEQGNIMTFPNDIRTIWVKIDIPRNIKPGNYPVTITFSFHNVNLDNKAVLDVHEAMLVEVLPIALPEQKLIYTRWFYVDCIAEQHDVEIYSEKHWELIEKYIAAAADVGINMLLIPTHTPPLDTAIGTTRPCVQLVDIEKEGEKYKFSFDKFKRFIEICKKNGIKYYEIAHMFSQWGAKWAPNILVTDNGKTGYKFGWHTEANSEEYVEFLKQYIAAISQELEKENISENTYFHISDEPVIENLETYRKASEIIRPFIGNSKTFDALSNYTFYEKGLVECPVTSVSHIHEFLEHEIDNQWVYYCCGPQKVFTNSLIAMPSYRTRILGFLLYKYNIKGFLHWGFNFYNSYVSYYRINPYLTTSADGAYPSGDPFIVYPSKNGVYSSIRGEITYEAIQDMDICFTLENLVGRDEVVRMIDEIAGIDLRFDDYPRCSCFLEKLRAAMVDKIRGEEGS